MQRLYTITGSAENIAIGAASVANATAFPAGTTHVRLASTGNARFRVAAAPVAVAADALITSGMEVFYPAFPGMKLAAIQDGAATGNLSVLPVALY